MLKDSYTKSNNIILNIKIINTDRQQALTKFIKT